jgi:ribonuclease HI
MKTLRVFTDGAARGNPGMAGIGVVIEDEHGVRLPDRYRYIDIATNNVAEYKALIEGMQAAVALTPDRIEIYLDSEVVVEQMNGRYKVRDPGLKQLFLQAKNLRDTFGGDVVIKHIGRERNRGADALANRAIDEHIGNEPHRG